MKKFMLGMMIMGMGVLIIWQLLEAGWDRLRRYVNR